MRVGLSGHQKMPEVAFEYASKEIENYLDAHKNVTGICSLAAGSDQLFAAKVIETGGELVAVIPSRNYEETFDEEGLATYKDLLGDAIETEVLDFSEPSEEAFYAAGKRVADIADEMIVVWDGEKAQGLGGTADIVDYARNLGKQVFIIWPEGVKR